MLSRISPMFCKKGLSATLSYTELRVAHIIQLMVLYDRWQGNSIFKNNQDSWGISYLSKHFSYVQRSHLLLLLSNWYSEFSPFYKLGTIFSFRDRTYVTRTAENTEARSWFNVLSNMQWTDEKYVAYAIGD